MISYQRYAQSEKGRAARKRAAKKYRMSEKGRAAKKKYKENKAKAAHRQLLDLMDRGIL